MSKNIIRPDDLANKMADKIMKLKEARKALDNEIKAVEQEGRAEVVNTLLNDCVSSIRNIGWVISDSHENQLRDLLDKIVRHDLQRQAYGLPKPPSKTLQRILGDPI